MLDQVYKLQSQLCTYALQGMRKGLHCLVAASLCLLPTPALADLTNEASVLGVTPRNTVITSPPSVEVITTAPAPTNIDVAQTMTFEDTDASGGWSAGDLIRISVVGTNTSGVDLTGLTVGSVFTADGDARTVDNPTYTLQSGDNGVPGTMEQNEVWTWVNSYTIAQADIDGGGDLLNIVTVEGTSGASTVTGQDTDAVSVVQQVDLVFTKTAVSSTFSNAGEAIDWEIFVRNEGNVTLSSLLVTDALADLLACQISGDATIAILAPQASETCVVQTTATPQNIADNQAINDASIIASLPSGVTIGRTATATLLVGDADLVTTKVLTSGNATPIPNATIVYTITVLNNGPANALNTSLTDLLPAGVEPTANNGVVSQGTYDEVTGLWSIGALASGESATLTLEGTVLASTVGTTVENTTTAASADQLDNSTLGDELTVTITPAFLQLVANDDTRDEPVNSIKAVDQVINVLANDTLNLLRVPAAAVTITTPRPLPEGIAISNEGWVSVAQNLAPAEYTFDYQICEVAQPTNCATATVSMEVVLLATPIIGQLFNDNNNDLILNGDDVALAGFTVQLIDENNVIVATDVTDAQGNYILSGFPPGIYRIIYLDPFGVGAGWVGNVGAGVTADDEVLVINLPADPSGVLYNSLSGDPVPGALAQLFNARQNRLLPDQCLLPRQQSQRTDDDGAYRFDIIVGADPLCPNAQTEYVLRIDEPLRFQPVPSANIPPQNGALSASVCPGDRVSGPACGLFETNNAPPVSDPSPYYFRFLIGQGSPDIIHNHIAIDPIINPATSGVLVAKTTDTPRLVRGDAARYSVDISNNGTLNYAALRFEDAIPQGMTFIVGSAELNGRPVTVEREANRISVDNIALPIGATVTLTYSTRVGANVQLGRKVNRAFMTSQSEQVLSAVSSAIVDIVPEPIFDCAEVIGRVFRDTNRNGIQDEGEQGLEGARIATATGTLITVDEFGRYSVPCAELPDSQIGTNYILKVDERSLPAGAVVTTENPKVARLTAGKATLFNFGVALARNVQIDLDRFAFDGQTSQLSSELEAGLRQLAISLADEPSVLQLNYYSEGESRDLISSRLQAVQNRVRTLMGISDNSDDLPVETRIFE